MSENVQYNIENSLKELEQLTRIGLFSEAEIRKVIKKRKLLEYKIAKLSKKKEDYLKYIQYEIALLALIRKRRGKMHYFHKKIEIDNSIGKRINSLFKAVIKRFPEDKKLWFSHHDFLKKMHWTDSMTRMHSRMLQIHNKSPAVWVTCAKWELEDNQNVENSRMLFQRAIRFHQNSQLIWREYFRMELMFVDQLLKRREVLGMNNDKEKVDDDDDVSESILEGQIAIVAYKQATEAVDDVQFALSFLPVCEDFSFTSDIKLMIYADVKERYADKEETWNALARLCLKQLPEEGMSQKRLLRLSIANALKKFENAVEVVPTEKMWDFYIQFLLDKMQTSTSQKKMRQLLQSVLNSMQRAADLKLLSPRLYIEWIRLLYSSEDIEKASEVALSASELSPADPAIWQFCCALHAQTTSNSDFLDIFHKAVDNVPSNRTALPLWQIAIEWATNQKNEYLQDILEKGLKQGPEVQLEIKKIYLELTALLLGIDETRSLYQRLYKMPPLSLEFFEVMIAAEKAQMVSDIKHIRTCFENAVTQIGDASVDVWLNYIELEKEHPNGNPVAVGKLYWTALKTLKPELSDEFVKKHTLISNTPQEC